MKTNQLLSMSLLGTALFAAGCSSLPKAADMTPSNIEIKNRAAQPVKVVVEGEPKIEGKKLQVANAELAQALRAAIEQSQLFTQVSDATTEGFLLELSVVGYNPPRPGFNMSATMTTRWKLTRLPTQEVIFEDFIKQTHTCTVGDAFVGAARWRKANEGVVRDTIADGLQRISQLDL